MIKKVHEKEVHFGNLQTKSKGRKKRVSFSLHDSSFIVLKVRLQSQDTENGETSELVLSIPSSMSWINIYFYRTVNSQTRK